MNRRILLEVCVASVDDALVAIAGGADRLELNSALALGGLTPSAGLMGEVRSRVSVSIVAMVRSRPGGFCYSSTDYDVMLRDARELLSAHADGLAFGILTESGEIDVPRCRRLREMIGDKQAVFHRAFDVTPDPFAALEALVELRFKRLMTSGQQARASDGAPVIAELIRRAAGRIEVLPAGGINTTSVADLVARTHCEQVHASLRRAVSDPSVRAQSPVAFGSATGVPEGFFEITDADAVARMRAALNQ
ncbi:MAG TPA: copper homeostasis protein CutC [Gemmataceae bacterium]|nr:copper homeostasis protein CutC [Gemmataceae bacterium]